MGINGPRAMADTPVVLLSGARQTGKATLSQEIAEGSGAQYFTLDDAARSISAGRANWRACAKGS
jgi:predicted AAA+ superfamily ATPase